MNVSLDFNKGLSAGMYVVGGYVISTTDCPPGQTASLQTGNIADDGHVDIIWPLDFLGGGGTVNFWCRASSEGGYDELTFYIDDVSQFQLSDDSPWTQYSYQISTSGPHTLRWSYTKDSSISEFLDCAFLSAVEAFNVAEPPNRLNINTIIKGYDVNHRYAQVTYEPKFEIDGIPPYMTFDAPGYTVDTDNYPLGSASSLKSRPILDSFCWCEIKGYFFLPGQISFYYKVDCSYEDYLTFYIDGYRKFDVFGGDVEGWAQVTYDVDVGFHKFLWRYDQYAAVPVGTNAIYIGGLYISNITFEPLQLLIKSSVKKSDSYWPVYKQAVTMKAKTTGFDEQFRLRSSVAVPVVVRSVDEMYKVQSILTQRVSTRMYIEPEDPLEIQNMIAVRWLSPNVIYRRAVDDDLHPGSYVLCNDGRVLYCFVRNNKVYLSFVPSEWDFFTVEDCVKATAVQFDVSSQFPWEAPRTCKLQRLSNGNFLLYVAQLAVGGYVFPEKIVVYESKDQGLTFTYKSTLREEVLTKYPNFVDRVVLSLPIALPSGRIGIAANIGGGNSAGLINSKDKSVFFYSDDNGLSWRVGVIFPDTSALYRYWTCGIAYTTDGTLVTYAGYSTLSYQAWQLSRWESHDEGATWHITDSSVFPTGRSSGVFFGEDGNNYIMVKEYESDVTPYPGKTSVWNGPQVAYWPAGIPNLVAYASATSAGSVYIDPPWTRLNVLYSISGLSDEGFIQAPKGGQVSVIYDATSGLTLWPMLRTIRRPRTASFFFDAAKNKHRVRRMSHKDVSNAWLMDPTVRIIFDQYNIGGITL